MTHKRIIRLHSAKFAVDKLVRIEIDSSKSDNRYDQYRINYWLTVCEFKIQNGCRPEIASATISLLVYSSILPWVMPRASFVILTFESASIFEIYNAVPSPSTVGLVAIITSVKLPFAARSINCSIVNCSGPMFSSGAMRPSSTWYSPCLLYTSPSPRD